MEPSNPSIDLATFGWRLAATLFFVLLNGFFVAAEFALVKVRVSRLEAMVLAGSGRARMAQHIHANLSLYLSACQLGITMASLILGWLAEPAIAELLLAGAAQAGWEIAPEATVLHGAALGIALAIVTTLHMTIGEQAPKIFAIQRAEATALAIAYPLRLFTAALRPFIWVINEISNRLLRGAGISAEEIDEVSHNVEELRSILATSAEAGHITGRQRVLAENILGFMDLEVRHILAPRVDVVFLSLQKSPEENLALIRASGHSRFPLCEVGLDSVIGIVHAKDVMATLVDKGDLDLRKLARQPVFVSDTQPLSRLILTLQRARSHTAVVLDEHGTAIGLVFLEDALEEIVGTIQDEFDQEPQDLKRVGPGIFEVAGSLSLPEAVEVLELPDPDEESDTIGGHVIALLGRLPRPGDELRIGNYRVTVIEVARRRIGRLRFESTQPASSEENPPEADESSGAA